ncbi:MAG TPA: amidohydrolase family protein [Burkholderiales bacterium]|nr:amidohydrolase family protein [Burkholderiales bacterium]
MSNSFVLIRNAAGMMTGLAGPAARTDARDLLIENGVISALGRNLPAPPGARVLDATDCVVYPGWVNTHHHLFQSLLKGVPAGINRTLTPWLTSVPYKYRRFFDADMIRLGATIGMVELMRSGCTTIADHHYIYYPDMPFDSSQILYEVADQLGLRFMLLRGVATRTRDIEAGIPNFLKPETMDGIAADMERLAGLYNDAGPRPKHRVAVAPSTPLLSLHKEELKPLAALARKLGIRMHAHLSETVSYMEQAASMHGMLPVQFVAEHDWVGPDVFYAHMVHLAPEEMRILAQTQTGMAHCPQSNGRLGSGVAPAPALMRLGAPVSIGVDGAASNEAADMISEVHYCWLAHRAHAGAKSRPRPEGAGEAGADTVTAEDVVHWATAGGAKVLGFDGIGTLEVGAAADIAVYSLDDPRFFGLHDPVIGPVVSGGRPKLKWLLVDGQVRVEDDVIPGLDLAELAAKARAAVRALSA